MKNTTILIIAMLSLITLTGCSNTTTNSADYTKGLTDGVTQCEQVYKPLLDQYKTPENCMMLIEGTAAQYVCQNTKKYDLVKEALKYK